jgi:hypothetical protein
MYFRGQVPSDRLSPTLRESSQKFSNTTNRTTHDLQPLRT